MQLPSGDIDVLAIGETLVDFISEEQVESLQDAYTFRKYLGGSPANIATNVSRLGKRAAVLSKTGSKSFGQFVKTELERHGVITDTLLMDQKAHTSFVFVARTRETPDFEVARSADYRLAPEEIDPSVIARSQIIHASTFALSREPARSAVIKAFRLAHDSQKITSLDPNYSPLVWPDREEAIDVLRELYPITTLTKPSLDDASRLFGPGLEPDEYIDKFHDLGPPSVVFTMGANGILLSTGGRRVYIPARQVNVADVTGAGDAFWAGFLVGFLDGLSFEKCARFAREIAAIKLAQVGPLPPGIDRLRMYELL